MVGEGRTGVPNPNEVRYAPNNIEKHDPPSIRSYHPKNGQPSQPNSLPWAHSYIMVRRAWGRGGEGEGEGTSYLSGQENFGCSK